MRILQQVPPGSPSSDRRQASTRALELCPDSEQALIVRALAEEEAGDADEAYRDLGRAIKVSASPLPYFMSRADLARRLGRIDDEIENLSLALELNSLSIDLRVYRAWAFARKAQAILKAGAPAARQLADQSLGRAESDLSGIRRHCLLDTVQGAIEMVRKELRTGP